MLLSLFSSLPSMPRQEGPLQGTLALMIGSYSNWLAATLRTQPQSQSLVAQLLQLLMHCKLLPCDAVCLPSLGC